MKLTMLTEHKKELISRSWDAAYRLTIRTGVEVKIRIKNELGKSIWHVPDYGNAVEIFFVVFDKECNGIAEARRVIQQKAFL